MDEPRTVPFKITVDVTEYMRAIAAARPASMAETAEDQRTRILAASPETNPTDYDLALALGYQPESHDGIWKLAAEHAFTFRHGYVIAREHIGLTKATRLRAHRLPEGWTIMEDHRLTEAEPHVVFVSPRMRQGAE